MNNTNPNLTAQLVALRDGLLEQRSNIRGRREQLLAEIADLDSDLEDNARRVEAIDEVVSIHDPDHVRLDVRTSDTPMPLMVAPRKRNLQLTASSATAEAPQIPQAAAGEATSASAAPAEPQQAAAPAAEQAPAAEHTPEAERLATPAVEAAKPSTRKKAAKAEAATETEATAPQKKKKPAKSAASRILISQYFDQFDKLALIVKSLESRGQPTTAAELGVDIKALYPIDLADQELKDNFSANISAYLNHMLKQGIVTKQTRPMEKGRDVLIWSLADDYKKVMKARRKPKAKAAGKKTRATTAAKAEAKPTRRQSRDTAAAPAMAE